MARRQRCNTGRCCSCTGKGGECSPGIYCASAHTWSQCLTVQRTVAVKLPIAAEHPLCLASSSACRTLSQGAVSLWFISLQDCPAACCRGCLTVRSQPHAQGVRAHKNGATSGRYRLHGRMGNSPPEERKPLVELYPCLLLHPRALRAVALQPCWQSPPDPWGTATETAGK